MQLKFSQAEFNFLLHVKSCQDRGLEGGPTTSQHRIKTAKRLLTLKLLEALDKTAERPKTLYKLTPIGHSAIQGSVPIGNADPAQRKKARKRKESSTPKLPRTTPSPLQMSDGDILRHTSVLVLSAKRNQILVCIPEWNPNLAVSVRRGTPQWPPGAEQPSVNMRYFCDVRVGACPQFLKWTSEPEGGDLCPLTKPAPGELPGPGERLPILNTPALDRLILTDFPKLSAEDRQKVAYLVRRAHGQGLVDSRMEAS